MNIKIDNPNKVAKKRFPGTGNNAPTDDITPMRPLMLMAPGRGCRS